MKGLNRVTLIGNLGSNPEYQILENNVSVAKFSKTTVRGIFPIQKRLLNN